MTSGDTFATVDNARKWRSLTVIAASQVAAMALWFSASAVVPALVREYDLSAFSQSLFTSSVQIGFVAGSFASALLSLPDRFDPRRIFMLCALFGSIVNAAILLAGPASALTPVLRFLTGAAMAGVYPVGMKLAGTWARRDMGLVVGLLVGALTLGSASPHLFNAFGGVDWRFTILAASISAGVAGIAINFAELGPNLGRAARLRPGAVLAAWRNVPMRLANLGYLGHMWELYAMWAWVGVFMQASFLAAQPGETSIVAAKYATFATIGIGALGCVAGGLVADRIGRTTLTMLAMGVSGLCACLIGFLFGAPPTLVVIVCLVWGVAVVADSAQFSASIAELAPPELVGTMLTLQTSLGFILTLATIHLIPYSIEWLGWTFGFAPLAIGPFLGIWAMAVLRARPEVARLAGGNR